VTRFLSGLKHDASHLDQLRDVIGQARDHRFQQTFLGRMRLRLRRSPTDATRPTSTSPLQAPPVA
jgi:hypothetical protein